MAAYTSTTATTTMPCVRRRRGVRIARVSAAGAQAVWLALLPLLRARVYVGGVLLRIPSSWSVVRMPLMRWPFLATMVLHRASPGVTPLPPC